MLTAKTVVGSMVTITRESPGASWARRSVGILDVEHEQTALGAAAQGLGLQPRRVVAVRLGEVGHVAIAVASTRGPPYARVGAGARARRSTGSPRATARAVSGCATHRQDDAEAGVAAHH